MMQTGAETAFVSARAAALQATDDLSARARPQKATAEKKTTRVALRFAYETTERSTSLPPKMEVSDSDTDGYYEIGGGLQPDVH
jgi:hypothetical protein